MVQKKIVQKSLKKKEQKKLQLAIYSVNLKRNTGVMRHNQ